jgi:hypothetical protein
MLMMTVDLHKRVAAAIASEHFTSHKMQESDLDGDQDLTLWIHPLEEVLKKEILNDNGMADHKHSSVKMIVSEEGERKFWASSCAASFHIAQGRCCPDSVPASQVIYIDCSFIEHRIPVKPIHSMNSCIP